jgi:hypothetical protein
MVECFAGDERLTVAAGQIAGGEHLVAELLPSGFVPAWIVDTVRRVADRGSARPR